jgi:predicted TIM-barrel fold metal-dependent hydrolase
VIIDHLGRIGMTGSIAAPDVDALCALARHPRVYVKVGAFYALGRKTPPYLDLAPLIERVVMAFGARRCMWESDCPFQVVSHKYTDSIALIRDRLDFLSKDDRDWLLARTAEQTLFRPRN